jgi:FMN-dependent NADH-azoreductase
MKLLHIDSSLEQDDSITRSLSAEMVTTLKAQHPDLEVTRLDLAVSPISHLSKPYLNAAHGQPTTAETAGDFAEGQTALHNFVAADIVVVGAPMYNFTIPSTLKAWIDRIAVPGMTFKYDENGLSGLCGNKRVFVASARGGIFSEGSATAFLDHQETYLKALFGFLGITDITFIRAEGIALGADQRSMAIHQAKKQISKIAL